MATDPALPRAPARDEHLPELDLRQLPAPEPLQRALAAADALQPGQSVRVLTPLVPAPLLELLAARGLHTTVSTLPGGGARVAIACPRREATATSFPGIHPHRDGPAAA